jgi:hypothetical protein
MQAIDLQNINVNTVKKNSFRKIIEWLEMPDSTIELYSPLNTQRLEVEKYIAKQYKDIYQAEIQEFLPFLMAFQCKNHLSAAVGFKCAANNPLFVEQYLDDSIEVAMSKLVHQDIERSSIIEIGNLAATWKGTSQLVLSILPIILERAGYKWAVFTATSQVQKLLSKIQINMTTLCAADVRRVNNENNIWGSYYDKPSPSVVFGSLKGMEARLSKQRIIKRLLEHYSDSIDKIVEQLQSQS